MFQSRNLANAKLTILRTTFIIKIIEDKKTKFYATLCNNHNQIIHNLQEIKKLTKDEKIREIINDTLDFSRYCKKQGQRMENRLKSYKNAITELGFQRVRKEKKEWD